MTSLFSLPFGLPGTRDERLWRYLQDEDWVSARVLLGDVVNEETTRPTWLLLLAYVRFRDAVDVVPAELLEASQQALALIERAVEHGAELRAVAPLRDAVERALDEATREELRLLSLTEDEQATVTLHELEALAVVLLRGEPARAAAVFERLSKRQGEGPAARVSLLRAALARARVQPFEAVRAELEQALRWDWSTPALRGERSVLEEVETLLLEHLRGAELEATWATAEALGRATGLPFPAVWPNQERVLRRLVALGQRERAVALAQRIEDEREELGAQLLELLVAARRATT